MPPPATCVRGRKLYSDIQYTYTCYRHYQMYIVVRFLAISPSPTFTNQRLSLLSLGRVSSCLYGQFAPIRHLCGIRPVEKPLKKAHSSKQKTEIERDGGNEKRYTTSPESATPYVGPTFKTHRCEATPTTWDKPQMGRGGGCSVSPGTTGCHGSSSLTDTNNTLSGTRRCCQTPIPPSRHTLSVCVCVCRR